MMAICSTRIRRLASGGATTRGSAANVPFVPHAVCLTLQHSLVQLQFLSSLRLLIEHARASMVGRRKASQPIVLIS